eukprot:768775-Hanusia_phi.AAC.7
MQEESKEEPEATPTKRGRTAKSAVGGGGGGGMGQERGRGRGRGGRGFKRLKEGGKLLGGGDGRKEVRRVRE